METGAEFLDQIRILHPISGAGASFSVYWFVRLVSELGVHVRAHMISSCDAAARR